jgi:hypothetical protein
LRLASFGNSEARFEFEVDVDPFERSRLLIIRHQIGARSYYPYEGRVYLEVRLDGEVLAERHLVPLTAYHEQAILVAWNRLASGARGAGRTRHGLSIRLDETSTTTYRLQEVEIWRRSFR